MIRPSGPYTRQGSVFRHGTQWNDPRPVASRWGEDAVLADEVDPRGRDEGGKFLQQFQGFESNMGRAVAPGLFEFVEQASVGQSFDRQWRPRSVTA